MKVTKTLVLFCALILAVTTGCQKPVFDGTRMSDDAQFVLEYAVLNRTEEHTMALEQGDLVDVRIESKSGRLDIVVTGPDGDAIYTGNNASSGSFALEIQQSGEFDFSVTGNNAKGSVSFTVR